MNANVRERLSHWLTSQNVPFAMIHHAPVYTSEEAARVRGTPLGSGAKALMVKAGEAFLLLVLPADRKLDSKMVQAGLGVKSLRFATKEELLQRTGLEPGAVPPFGSLFELPTVLDPDLAAYSQINFNAGDHRCSISMAYDDYLRVEQPQCLKMSRPPNP